jgi:AraC-like DNA-binding protein
VDGFETYWKWPEEIGIGHMSMISPRPGIKLEIGNYRLKEDIAISFEQTHHEVLFGFNVSGSMRYTTDSGKGQQAYWGLFKQGHNNMGYLPKCRLNIAMPPVGIQTYYVLINIDPLFLKTFLDEQHDRMPIALRNIMNGTEEQDFNQTLNMSPAGNMAIQQIINCPYRSTLKRLFLEGKALELISYSLAQVVTPEDPFQNNTELRPNDMESAMEARNILISNLENPPSLLALAKQVGTNKNKLNKRFKQIFGTSVFDYLRMHRLERAKELLDNKNMSVGEAAAHVGYSHQSSFTRAFKNHFGTIPTGHPH